MYDAKEVMVDGEKMVDDIIGNTQLMIVLVTDNCGRHRGQALCCTGEKETDEGILSKWYFGPIKEYPSSVDLDLGIAELCAAANPPVAYIVRVNHGSNQARCARIDAKTGQVSLGIMNLEAVDAIVRPMQQAAGENPPVYLVDVLEPEPDRVEEHTTDAPFSEDEVVN